MIPDFLQTDPYSIVLTSFFNKGEFLSSTPSYNNNEEENLIKNKWVLLMDSLEQMLSTGSEWFECFCSLLCSFEICFVYASCWDSTRSWDYTTGISSNFLKKHLQTKWSWLYKGRKRSNSGLFWNWTKIVLLKNTSIKHHSWISGIHSSERTRTHVLTPK